MFGSHLIPARLSNYEVWDLCKIGVLTALALLSLLLTLLLLFESVIETVLNGLPQELSHGSSVSTGRAVDFST